MALIYLVRHGQAAAGFDQDHDPGLNDIGHAQAKAVSGFLAPNGPMRVLSSPLRRCRETSEPICQAWNATAKIVEAVAEIPSPTESLSERAEWLRSIMPGRWKDIGDPALEIWRRNAIEAIAALDEDTVVFSHFIAINAITGHIQGDDRMVVFRPGNCSVTILEAGDRRLSLVELGAEAKTKVG